MFMFVMRSNLHAYSFMLQFSCFNTKLISICFFESFCNLAQVTQWGLILHGTEEPAQPNDPKSFDFSQPDAKFLGEIDQNLDFDQTETGQWRNLHQVIQFINPKL